MLHAIFLALAVGQPDPADAWDLLYDDKVAIRLTAPRFTAGVRALPWAPGRGMSDANPAAAPAKKPAAKTPPLPDHLEFREETSTLFKDGIITYIPLASLVRLDYDVDKKLVRAVVAQPDGKELVLSGSTRFVGINKFNVEGAVLPAAVTLPAATLQVHDGLLKTPIRGIRLRADAAKAEAPAAPAGRAAVVVAADKEKSEHRVFELTPVYQVAGKQRLAPVLMFQKIGQLDIAKVAALRHLPPAKKQATAPDYEVTLADGTKQTLALLEKTTLDDNQPAQLIGLAGRVAAGWKLFPPHTIAVVRWESEQK